MTPEQVAANFVDVGIKKTSLPAMKMLCLGIFAGIFIAMAGAGSAVAACTVPDLSTSRFINALVFPGGLAMVVLAGSELFTGNSLIVISVLQRKVRLSSMLRNWGIVYAGNLIGSLLVALTAVGGHMPDLFGEGLAVSMVSAAAGKASLSFPDAFLRGVLCNILVCISVWVAAAANSAHGKVIALYLPIMLFVICGFEHCVANMFCIPAGIFTAREYEIAAEGLNWLGFLKNIIPVTLGNIVGGVLTGAGYWFIYLRQKRRDG